MDRIAASANEVIKLRQLNNERVVYSMKVAGIEMHFSLLDRSIVSRGLRKAYNSPCRKAVFQDTVGRSLRAVPTLSVSDERNCSEINLLLFLLKVWKKVKKFLHRVSKPCE